MVQRQISQTRLKALSRFDMPADDDLEALADHCIAARGLIDRHGSPQMRRLIDLLLFEVGVMLAAEAEEENRRDGAE